MFWVLLSKPAGSHVIEHCVPTALALHDCKTMPDLPNTNTLETDVQHAWLTIWLNRIESRNALNEQMTTELRNILELVRDDRSVRGITLRGRGGVFCAGGDLKAFRSDFQGGERSKELVAAASRRAGELFWLVNELPQVVVILVEGAAIAGGLGLACAGDLVVVTRESRFALTETTLGIAPAQIAPFVVQRVGLSVARRLMLTAARFDGEQAQCIGLADQVVDGADALDEAEQKIRTQVMRCAPGANAITKELVLATARLEPQAMLDLAAERFAEGMLSSEGREGISAFIEKRKPSWSV